MKKEGPLPHQASHLAADHGRIADQTRPAALIWDLCVQGPAPWSTLGAIHAACAEDGVEIATLRLRQNGTVTLRLTPHTAAPIAKIEAALREAGLTLLENTVTLTGTAAL